MRRRIQMRPIMLEHPEASREVAVFLNRGVDLGFEELRISGPWHQLVADRVTQVEHPRLSSGNAFKDRIAVRVLKEECGKSSKANNKNAGAAKGSHLSPQFICGIVADRAHLITAAEFPASRRSRPCAGVPDTPGPRAVKRPAGHSSAISSSSTPDSCAFRPRLPAGAVSRRRAGPPRGFFPYGRAGPGRDLV